MAHTLPKLPFSKDALTPHISVETIDYHYGKHHQAYVNNLNNLLQGTGLETMPLEELMATGLEKCPAEKKTGVFNNAAQVWNHTFYWNCVTPGGGSKPTGNLEKAVNNTFGGLEQLKEVFTKTAVGTFGSGWAWLVKDKSGKIEVVSTSNAKNPMTEGKTPLLTCDVWEHAYYIDYRNDRATYVATFWNMINWNFVSKNFG